MEISLSNHIRRTALRSLLYPCFADEDVEAQRGEVSCLGSHNGEKWSRASSPRPLTPHLVFLLSPQAASQILWDSRCLPPGEVMMHQSCKMREEGGAVLMVGKTLARLTGNWGQPGSMDWEVGGKRGWHGGGHH